MSASPGTFNLQSDTDQSIDVARIRQDFPILSQHIHGRPLVYLDNAATTQKPLVVIEALDTYYRRDNSNIHRGVHTLSQRATTAYENSRETMRRFLGADSTREIIFLRGATEGINLVASTFGRRHIKAGDEMLITEMEHHSNIVPWQMLCDEAGATLKVAPINDRGELILDQFEALLRTRTRLVSVGHVSNALGTINPIRDIVRLAHGRNVPVLVDGAQAAPHLRVNVKELGCDFYTFSGHKIYGPTGIGVLYGREDLLEEMPPYQGGGDMISSVSFAKTIYNDLPYKFEAGTPNIAGAIGLGAAIDYVEHIGIDAIGSYEQGLLQYATERLEAIPGLKIIGTAAQKASVISFCLEAAHPHDIGTILDREGVAIRTGHHCAQPVMDRFGVPATARASFAMYNSYEEIDALVRAIGKVLEVFG